MLRLIFILISIAYCYLCNAQSTQPTPSPFHLNETARATLCPFVGFEGMQCFDNKHMRRSGRRFDSGIMRLPRGVGMTIDQITGEIKILAARLTYGEEGNRVWTDGYTGNMFDTITEANLGAASGIVATFDASRVRIFRNASEIENVWRQRFIDGRIRGGELSRRPDMLEYSNE